MVDWLQRYALFIPSVSAFEMIKGSYFGDPVRTYYDLEVAILV